MKIGGPEIPNDEDGNPFLTLRDLIRKPVSVGTLASAIEQNGVYTWDRFGRFGMACDSDKEIALRLLAEEHAWEVDPDAPIKNDPRSPLEQTEDLLFGPFDRFGWAQGVAPDFDKIRQNLVEEAPKRVAKVRRKAPDAFVGAFVRLVVEIAKRDSKINIDKMPGIKDDLRAVAIKFDEHLEHPLSTFDSYIEGLCKFSRGSRHSQYYEKLFPEHFK